MSLSIVGLCLAVLLIAGLYSSVGHAGASGYIAVLSLFSVVPSEIKPIALVLNILVASITTWQFWRKGLLKLEDFLPFALLAVPCSFLGGYLNLSPRLFQMLLGIVLLCSALRFLIQPIEAEHPTLPKRPIAVIAGGAIGFLAGLTGTGGGIFLTPLLVMKCWTSAKKAAAMSALFILVNSIAGLLGNLAATQKLPIVTVGLLIAVAIGGSIGSYYGSQQFSHRLIQRCLAVVLTIAGCKLLLT